MSELPALHTIPDTKDHELWFCDALPPRGAAFTTRIPRFSFPLRA